MPCSPFGRGDVQALRRLVDDRAELAQRLQVEVDRPVADVAAAEVGDERVPEPVQQRAAEQDRDPARPGVHVDLVDVGALHIGRVEDQLARLDAVADPDPVQLQQPADDLDVADARHVVQPARGSRPRSAATIALETRFLAPRTRTSPRSGVLAVDDENVAGTLLATSRRWSTQPPLRIGQGLAVGDGRSRPRRR